MVRWGGLIDAMVDNCADVIVWDWAYAVDIFADVYVEHASIHSEDACYTLHKYGRCEFHLTVQMENVGSPWGIANHQQPHKNGFFHIWSANMHKKRSTNAKNTPIEWPHVIFLNCQAFVQCTLNWIESSCS